MTMQREWEGLDRLRLDKFYMFIQTFLKECFQLLKTNKWSRSVVEEFASMVAQGPLQYTSTLVYWIVLY
jgi:ribosomal RNA-processing protein 1